MNEIMQFEDTNVKIIKDENSNPLFELYSTGMALGYVKYAKDKPYPKKDRIDIIVKNAEITAVVQNGQLFLTEPQLYDFMLEAHTNKCRKFRKWVTNEVLPSIRRSGEYSVNSSQSIAPQHGYEYKPQTYNGIPVITISDICRIFNRTYSSIYNFVHLHLHSGGDDYLTLRGAELKAYFEENSSVPTTKGLLCIIFQSGFEIIAKHFGFDIENIPDDMKSTARGYVVQEEVRKVMEYIRREMKGIEALTYLIESNDSRYNLECYRKALIRKLNAVEWWVMDASTVELGIHQISATERTAIFKGEYGMRL